MFGFLAKEKKRKSKKYRMGNSADKDSEKRASHSDRRSGRGFEPVQRPASAVLDLPDIEVKPRKKPVNKGGHPSNVVSMTIEDDESVADSPKLNRLVPPASVPILVQPSKPDTPIPAPSSTPVMSHSLPSTAVFHQLPRNDQILQGHQTPSPRVPSNTAPAQSLIQVLCQRIDKIFPSLHTVIVVDHQLNVVHSDRVGGDSSLPLKELLSTFGQINQTGEDLAHCVESEFPQWSVMHFKAGTKLFSAYSLGHALYFLVFFSSEPNNLIHADQEMISIRNDLEQNLQIHTNSSVCDDY